MPRDIPVGNGSLLVTFDCEYKIRDLFFPHVGQENHTGGRIFRFGIRVDDNFSWLGKDNWKIKLAFEKDTLVTRVDLHNADVRIAMKCRDCVDFHENIYLKEVEIENLGSMKRKIEVFFGQDFGISGNTVGDTAVFDPETGAIVHYKGNRYFLINGLAPEEQGFNQYATGQKELKGREGTYLDAEDGLLSLNPIAQGSVDSVVSLIANIDKSSSARIYYWIAAGENWDEVRILNAVVRDKGPEVLINRTADYWKIWLEKETPPIHLFPPEIGEIYKRSLLVLRTQIDWAGGVTAANDSDVIMFNRDTYSYIWPRDGAFAAYSFDMAGYPIISQNFYNFIARVINKEGFLLHKYNPDGSLASSWHPWYDKGKKQLPIQEDETALVIWALWHHFVIYRDIEFIKPLYKPLIKNSADFMCNYRDNNTGLPAASYDLWEERRGILTFTTGAVFGGLTAASLFCSVFGEDDMADKYRKTAAEIREAASMYLWRQELGRFCRMIIVNDDNEIEVDSTPDASIYGIFAFGLYDADDERVESTMSALKKKLWIDTNVGGMARYDGDTYHRTNDDLPGNPWFVCTMWYADYIAEKAKNEEELREAIEILEWVTDHALPSGVLAEQVHPFTGKPLSVSPLTWSHATFVSSVQRILRRMADMNICPECGFPTILIGRKVDWIVRLFPQACDDIHGVCKI